MSELRAQVAEAVKARRLHKAKTRTNQKYLKMSRKSLGAPWSRSEDTSLEHPSQGLKSVQRKATKKRQIANGKRLLKIWQDATANAPRNAKKKRQQKSKKAAEEGTAGIQIRN
jgi:hypothetical protein